MVAEVMRNAQEVEQPNDRLRGRRPVNVRKRAGNLRNAPAQESGPGGDHRDIVNESKQDIGSRINFRTRALVAIIHFEGQHRQRRAVDAAALGAPSVAHQVPTAAAATFVFTALGITSVSRMTLFQRFHSGPPAWNMARVPL